MSEAISRQNRLDLINSLFSNSKWELTTARKQYTDEFGKTIKPFDVYYRRSIGYNYSDNLKLTVDSFERLYQVTFFNNLGLTSAAIERVNLDKEKLRQDFAKFDSWLQTNLKNKP